MSVMMTTDTTHRPELSNSQLLGLAPAIFADQPIAEVSDRYHFVPTIQVVDGLRDAGWFPVDAKQGVAQKLGNADKSLHMVRFRHPDLQPIGDDGLYPEAILTNSHNRSAAFKFMLGLFRMLCSNGIITSDASFGGISVRHNNSAIDGAIEACKQLTEQAPNMITKVEDFRTIQLAPTEREIFARSALNMKHGVHTQQLPDGTEKPTVIYGRPWEYDRAVADKGEDNVVYVPVEPSQLLQAHRADDQGTDLWTTYNVIQENLIKGGTRGRSVSRRRSRTRGISAVSEDVRVNKNLWGMAEYLAEHATVVNS